MNLCMYACMIYILDMLVAPLWDSNACQFVGLLTVTDCIDVLLQRPQSGASSIAAVFRQPPHFGGIDAGCTLMQACRHLLALQSNPFVPIVYAEDMRCLACITYTNILEFLVMQFREQRRLFDDSIRDLNIGTYTNLVTVYPDQTIAEALQVMQQHHRAAVPVIDRATKKVVGMYSRADCTFLVQGGNRSSTREAPAAQGEAGAMTDFSLTIEHVLAQQQASVTTPDALRTCSPNHTLQAIFESFAAMRFNRLCVVDEAEQLVGIVSARDLVAYFLCDEDVTS